MENEKKFDDLNFGINLKRLPEAFMQDIRGRKETKRCICIPVDTLYCGEKGVYLDLHAFGLKEPNDDGQTHLIKRNLSRKERESMTPEEIKALPILGNITPVKKVTAADEAAARPVYQAEAENDEDLPF